MRKLGFILLILASCAEPGDHTVETLQDNQKNEMEESVDQIDEVIEDSLVSTDFAGNEQKGIYPLTYNGPAFCLPYPNDRFLHLKETNSLPSSVSGEFILDECYHFLTMTVDSVARKKVLERNTYDEIKRWGQEFDHGIYYSYEQVESGGNRTLWTRCKDRMAFVETIKPVIEYIIHPGYYEVGYAWNEDFTSYSPDDGEAGCYYDILVDAEGYVYMTWYCGC